MYHSPIPTSSIFRWEEESLRNDTFSLKEEQPSATNCLPLDQKACTESSVQSPLQQRTPYCREAVRRCIASGDLYQAEVPSAPMRQQEKEMKHQLFPRRNLYQHLINRIRQQQECACEDKCFCKSSPTFLCTD